MTVISLGALTELRNILLPGLTTSALMSATRLLGSLGLPFLQGYHYAKQIDPELSYSDFGDMYTNPRLSYQQERFSDKSTGDEHVPDHLIIETPLSRPRQYRYIIETSWINPDDLEPGSAHYSFYDDEKLTINEVEERALEVFGRSATSGLSETDEIRFTTMEHNSDWN